MGNRVPHLRALRCPHKHLRLHRDHHLRDHARPSAQQVRCPRERCNAKDAERIQSGPYCTSDHPADLPDGSGDVLCARGNVQLELPGGPFELHDHDDVVERRRQSDRHDHHG